MTSASLFAIAYRGASTVWVAGRGGAILRRTSDLATVKIPLGGKGSSKPPPGAPKLKGQENQNDQANATGEDDIPRAKPPVRKPQKP